MPIGIAAPHSDRIIRRHAHRPGVPVTVARAGLPGGFADGPDEFPVDLIGPVDFLQGFEGVPEGDPVPERGVRRQSVIVPDHARIGSGDVGQGSFAAAQD